MSDTPQTDDSNEALNLKAARVAFALAICMTIVCIALMWIGAHVIGESKITLVDCVGPALFFLPGHWLTGVVTVRVCRQQAYKDAVPVLPAFVGFCSAMITGIVLVAAIGQHIAGFLYAYLGFFVGIVEAPFWMLSGGVTNKLFRRHMKVQIPTAPRSDRSPNAIVGLPKTLFGLLVVALAILVSVPSTIAIGILLSIYGGGGHLIDQTVAAARFTLFNLPANLITAAILLRTCIRKNQTRAEAAQFAALTGFKYTVIIGVLLLPVQTVIHSQFDLVAPVVYALLVGFVQVPFWLLGGALLSASLHRMPRLTNPATSKIDTVKK